MMHESSGRIYQCHCGYILHQQIFEVRVNICYRFDNLWSTLVVNRLVHWENFKLKFSFRICSGCTSVIIMSRSWIQKSHKIFKCQFEKHHTVIHILCTKILKLQIKLTNRSFWNSRRAADKTISTDSLSIHSAIKSNKIWNIIDARMLFALHIRMIEHHIICLALFEQINKRLLRWSCLIYVENLWKDILCDIIKVFDELIADEKEFQTEHYIEDTDFFLFITKIK